jgi:DNA-binding transcriptional LysR family regulator
MVAMPIWRSRGKDRLGRPPEPLAEPFLRSGQLVRVLEDWSPSFEGLFLYYPGHRQVPATLRAVIDMIRTAGGSAATRRSLQNPFTKD